MSFSNLMQNRQSALSSLQQKVASTAEQGGGNKDPRVWKLHIDKTTKVGSAVIRFLPSGGYDETGNMLRVPWAEWFEFSFKTPAGNYWNRSLKTLGKDDPVAELNAMQWERNQGDDQDKVKGRKRKTRYKGNIVVVNDPANPENNGKVFLYEWGPAIHEKLMAAQYPQYEDQTPIHVFDMFAGANFRLRTKDKSGFVNYDDSSFDSPSQLHQDTNVMENFYNAMYDLEEFENESNYKSYEELTKEMTKVLGARLVASVKGEEFSPGQAAQSGANPFDQQQQPGSQQQGIDFSKVNQNQQGGQGAQAGHDPFANQNQQAGHDPFANQNQQEAQGGHDPFANQNQQGGQSTQSQQGSQPDPFAKHATDAGADQSDPFANMKV